MRVVRLLVVGLALFLLSSALPVWARDDEQLEQKIDLLLSQMTRSTDPGLALLIKKDASDYFEKGYGLREIGKPERIEPSTNFRLASDTKQFTAVGIMLLVHDGKLRYEDHLTDIWPDFPAYGKEITLRHLLTHTSGLPDYEQLMEEVEKKSGPRWSAEHQIQDEEVLSLLKQQSAGRFPPGTSWAYSNSGYVVLGMVIAKKSGTSYREFMERRIFAPLNMKHSVVYQKGKNKISERAFGHSNSAPDSGAPTPLFQVDDQSATSATLGDGGIYSNLEDLSKWDGGLQNHTLLSAAEMAPALTPVKLTDGSEPHWPSEPGEDNLAPGKPVSYGFGWFVDYYDDRARMWHPGSTEGFRSVIQRFSTSGVTIVILSNRSDMNPKALSEKIADLIFAENRK